MCLRHRITLHKHCEVLSMLQISGGSGLIFVKTKKAASGLYRLLECTRRFWAASVSKLGSL